MAGEAEWAIGAPIRPVRSFLGAAGPRLDMIHYRFFGRVEVRPLKRDEIGMNRHRASGCCLSMILSENRCALFRIML
jgi:hypothetical protein